MVEEKKMGQGIYITVVEGKGDPRIRQKSDVYRAPKRNIKKN